MREIETPESIGPRRNPPGPVVVWNLIRRCNLTCKHCYSLSVDKDFPGELSAEEVAAVMQDLRAFGVPVLILSGGEPLLRPDIFELSRHAKELGFYVGLSSNGTLIDATMAAEIAKVGYDYVGVSLDGIGTTHDAFRRREGAFDEALAGIRLCRETGVKVGLRFTMTQDNEGELPALLDLLVAEDLDRFYFSHLNYAGRGNHNRASDAVLQSSRRAMDILFERALADRRDGHPMPGSTSSSGPTRTSSTSSTSAPWRSSRRSARLPAAPPPMSSSPAMAALPWSASGRWMAPWWSTTQPPSRRSSAYP